MAKQKEKKIVYYKDEISDDFANNSISTKKLKEDYRYIRRNPLTVFFSMVLRYLIAVPILTIVAFFTFGVKVKNKQVLKYVKKRGYFIYANHTQHLDPCFHAVMVNPSKYTCIIAGPDAFSINPFISFLVRNLGTIPIPNTKKMYANYLKAISYHVKKKHNILIYPEKHIWPYFNDIRYFTADTFRYPVMNKTPIITATTVYKKSKYFKRPRIYIYLDGPFYPDKTLPLKDATNLLRDQAYNAMKTRSKVSWNYEYIKYVKIDDNNDVIDDKQSK